MQHSYFYCKQLWSSLIVFSWAQQKAPEQTEEVKESSEAGTESSTDANNTLALFYILAVPKLNLFIFQQELWGKKKAVF